MALYCFEAIVLLECFNLDTFCDSFGSVSKYEGGGGKGGLSMGRSDGTWRVEGTQPVNSSSLSILQTGIVSVWTELKNLVPNSDKSLLMFS
jgi:hypothetical protein